MTPRIACLAACFIFLVCCGCSSSTPAAAKEAPDPAQLGNDTKSSSTPDHSISVAGSTAPVSQDLVVTGPVTMEQQLEVVAQRPGLVAALDADVDSKVRAGQILAQLDDRQILEDRSAAEAKLRSLEADVKNREAEVQVRTADLSRAQQMRDSGINTVEDLEHTRFALAATQFDAEHKKDELESQRATVESLRLEFDKTRIAAPFAGVISQRYVRTGEYVRTGDRLFQVTGNSPLEIRFTLPARQGVWIRRGDRVIVSPSPDFRSTAQASVTHISPVVDPGSGTVEVTAVLANPLPGLLPGMIASIRVSLPDESR